MVELKLLDKKDETLLSRTSYLFEADIGNSPTPSRLDLRTFAAKFLKIDDDNLVIESVKAHFGDSKIVFSVRAYSSAKALKQIELPWRIKRNTGPKKDADENQKPEEDKKEAKPEDKADKKDDKKQDKESE